MLLQQRTDVQRVNVVGVAAEKIERIEMNVRADSGVRIHVGPTVEIAAAAPEVDLHDIASTRSPTVDPTTDQRPPRVTTPPRSRECPGCTVKVNARSRW